MGEGLKKLRPGDGTTQENHRPTGAAPATGVTTKGLASGRSLSVARKTEEILRIVCGDTYKGGGCDEVAHITRTSRSAQSQPS